MLLPSAWNAVDPAGRFEFVRLFRALSDIAYCDETEGSHRLHGELALNGTLFRGDGRQAFPMVAWVVPVDGDVVIAFRGTDGFPAILQDLKVIRRRSDEGGLHGGFASGYDGLHDRLVSQLRRSRPKRVWLTGHSLGGALAVVAAWKLADAGFDVGGIVTFGQPRVCLADLARTLGLRFQDRYLAFVNNGDPVPKAVFPYVHFGWRLIYDGLTIVRDGLSIVRIDASAGVLPAGGTFATRAPDDEGMLPGELDALIDELEQEEADVRGEADADGGDRRFAGSLIEAFFAQHSLTVYASAVEVFLSSLPPAREIGGS